MVLKILSMIMIMSTTLGFTGTWHAWTNRVVMMLTLQVAVDILENYVKTKIHQARTTVYVEYTKLLMRALILESPTPLAVPLWNQTTH